MAAYSGGSVKIIAGSSKVYGSNTEFITFLEVGDLFKITSENTFYGIAAINTATELTLTSRYTKTNLQSAVSTNLASVNTATINYSGNVGSFTPVIQNNFWLVASPNAGGEKFTDDGGGILTGENTPAGSGTIDYDSGSWTIAFGTPLTATVNLVGSFLRGTSQEGLAYQVVSDFTPNYKIPEMSTNDVNFSHIYTQAMRTIDQKIKAATNVTGVKSITASYLEVYSIATLNNVNMVNATITNASIQKLKATNASFNNASVNTLKVTSVMGRIAVTNALLTNATVTKLRAVNASFTNASIQKLKAINASFNNASVNTLKVTAVIGRLTVTNALLTNATVTKLSGVNASFTNASIQNLKVLSLNHVNMTAINASITNASIQKLKTINASFTNASIQKLKAINASFNNASINVLKVTSFTPTNLTAVNASITNATIGQLLVNASRLRENSTYDGYSLNATMSATVAFGQILYVDSDFDYSKANSATSGTLPVTAMAVSAGTNRQNIILRGQVCNTSWNWSATALIYVAATDGALTQKIPTGSGKFMQIIGHPLSADTMFFEPNLNLFQIT